MKVIYHRFICKNYPFLLPKLVEACDATGLEPKDLILELDCAASQYGAFPSIDDLVDDLTIFKFVPAQGYIDGSRPEEADWFSTYHQDPEHHEKKKKTAAALVKESAANSSVGLAGLVHYAECIERFQLDKE
mmetsp:Transcript_12539/g.29948  ORF Transcript_12539/g.29948 Transcript_12539/m.29948 type:complete len:132 (+) Transcript_12539:1339-1734(+)